MKRPIRIVFPPCRAKYRSTRAKRSGVIRTLCPWRIRKSRPSLRPRRKLTESPARAAAHTTPIVSTIEVSPCPATAPPRITAVSPGNTSPMKAPVSRNAARPTRT